jgi:hypothetical protein
VSCSWPWASSSTCLSPSSMRERLDARYHKPYNNMLIFGMLVANISLRASLRASDATTALLQARVVCRKTLFFKGAGEFFMRIPFIPSNTAHLPMAVAGLLGSLRGRSSNERPPVCANSKRAHYSIRPVKELGPSIH